MQVVHAISEVRAAREAARRTGTVGFVPTMGALHAGHAQLIERAREQSDFVVVSVFVNGPQFNQREDFERYARTLPADVELCAGAGADLVFAPSDAEMYPEPMGTVVDAGAVAEHFCGASRPGHFRAVATVVAKLFGIVQPDVAFFGEKDAQQLAVIERMVRDLNFAVRVVPVGTVREPDGLAMSSRNARLSAKERRIAICLWEALQEMQRAVESGERETARVVERGREWLERPGVRVDYLDLANPRTMAPVMRVEEPVRAMGAIWVGDTRLIDNLMCFPEKSFHPN